MKNSSKPGRPLSLSASPQPKELTESEALLKWGIKAEMRLKRAMQARGWGYQELSEALLAEGIKRNATVINRRINRGNFSAAFFLVCLYVLERDGGAEKVKAEAPGAHRKGLTKQRWIQGTPASSRQAPKARRHGPFPRSCTAFVLTS